MTTPRPRSLVSLSALTATLALAACAHAARRVASGAPASVTELRFANDALQPVHVYVLGEQREWLLGRVEPGARAILRLPGAALARSQGFVRLAVLAGAHPTLRAASDPRASITIAQPAASILTQRWTYSSTVPLGLTGMPLGHR